MLNRIPEMKKFHTFSDNWDKHTNLLKVGTTSQRFLQDITNHNNVKDKIARCLVDPVATLEPHTFSQFESSLVSTTTNPADTAFFADVKDQDMIKKVADFNRNKVFESNIVNVYKMVRKTEKVKVTRFSLSLSFLATSG